MNSLEQIFRRDIILHNSSPFKEAIFSSSLRGAPARRGNPSFGLSSGWIASPSAFAKASVDRSARNDARSGSGVPPGVNVVFSGVSGIPSCRKSIVISMMVSPS